MKKRRLMMALFCFSIVTFQKVGFGNPEAREYDWKAKLKRGALNIVTSPVEVARQIQITSNGKNLLNGWTVGLIQGIGQGFIRLGAGAVDVLTSPFNFPDSHKGPLVEPEYVWQKPGIQYS